MAINTIETIIAKHKCNMCVPSKQLTSLNMLKTKTFWTYVVSPFVAPPVVFSTITFVTLVWLSQANMLKSISRIGWKSTVERTRQMI